MHTIISKRDILKFYFYTIIATLLLVAVGSGLLYNLIRTAGKNESKAILLFPLFSIACYVLAVYNLYRYNKNTPKIKLDQDSITFNKKTYPLSDLKKVELTGKQPFKYIFNFRMEGAALTFNDDNAKYIFDDMYSNSWEIKSFLQQVVLDKKDYFQRMISPIDKDAVVRDSYETYKGNQLTSYRGILLWGMIGCFIYMAIKKDSFQIGIVAILSVISFFLFIGFSNQMHYFQVSQNYFLIRNHNFFWKKKVYNIADIREIVFETQGKLPNCLRVITKDFRSQLYQAGTLRDKTWLELKDKLDTYNIPVRNECI